MLTQSEKAWLERREEMPGYYCRWCPLWDNEADCDGRSPHPFCPMFNRREWLMGALVFEARVAAKLAEFYHHTTLYLDDSDGQKLRCWETCPARFYCGDSYTHLTCGDAVLKTAQLAVEEEMDADSK